MAPGASLERRQSYYCDGYNNCYYSTWNSWGRWAALAVIIVCAILLALACSCFNSRRRRRRGMAPMYGTGWMAAPPPGQPRQQYGGDGAAGYYQQELYNGAPAPPYSPPVKNNVTGNTFTSGEGYYGGQQSGIELQEPSSSYQPQRGGAIYEPPVGPPPTKNDGVIR